MSKSPERNTFQLKKYVERCEEKGEEPSENYLNLWKTIGEREEENLKNLEWQKNNLEYDLRSTEWILEKVRNSDTYAQNLYASMCNNDFIRNEVWPILKEDTWSCSWRHAGGIIADMREEGDYIDWYCSGIGSGLGNGDEDGFKNYVGESVVTDEIRADLFKLGWLVREHNESK